MDERSPGPGLNSRKIFSEIRKRLVVVAAVLPLVDVAGRHWWLADLATHFRVYWCIAIGFLFLLTLASRSRGWWRAFGCALVIYAVWPIVPFYLPPPKGPNVPPPMVPTVRIATINVNYANDNYAAVESYFEEQDPDIVLLLETGADWHSGLSNMNQNYPFQVTEFREHAFGAWLLSKYRVSDVSQPAPDEDYPVICCTVATPMGSLWFVGLHPRPPVGALVSAENLKWLKLGAKRTRERPQGMKAVLAGDLNATPFTGRFRDLLAETGLRNSALGFGLTRTWHSGIPLLGLPIDYILVSNGITVLNHEVGPDIGSDHRPLLVDIGWRN